MRIVELGDYSMTIMKSTEDAPWDNLADIYHTALEKKRGIGVLNPSLFYSDGIGIMKSSEFIYSGRRLVLFFKDRISENFKTGDIVKLYLYV